MVMPGWAPRWQRTFSPGSVCLWSVEGETHVPIPTFEGAAVKLVLKTRSGGLAAPVLEGAEGKWKANGPGTSFKTSFVGGPAGTVFVVATPSGADPVELVYKVRVKPPKQEALIPR